MKKNKYSVIYRCVNCKFGSGVEYDFYPCCSKCGYVRLRGEDMITVEVGYWEKYYSWKFPFVHNKWIKKEKTDETRTN